jgi:ligand-binding sensor domain-containing protein
MPLRRIALVPVAAVAAATSGPALLASPAAVASTGALAGTSVLSLASFGGRLWAGTDSGLDVESAAGIWAAAAGPVEGREINALAVVGPWLVAGTEDGAVRTTDGANWVAAGLGGERVASLGTADGTLLAGTGQETPANGIAQRSDDDGGSWAPASSSPALLGLPGETVQAVLAPAAGTPAWAATAGGGAYRSGDGRAAWSDASAGLASSWVTSFWRDPTSRTLLAGTDDGLYAWAGSSWAPAAFPQQDPWVQTLATARDGHVLAGTYDGSVLVQAGPDRWTALASGLPSVLSLLALPRGGVLVGTSDGLACIGCPASVAGNGGGVGRQGARPAASLPPPAARAGATRPAVAGGAGRATAGGTPASPGPGAASPATTEGAGGGGPGRWWLGGVLVALSGLLFTLGQRRRH